MSSPKIPASIRETLDDLDRRARALDMSAAGLRSAAATLRECYGLEAPAGVIVTTVGKRGERDADPFRVPDDVNGKILACLREKGPSKMIEIKQFVGGRIPAPKLRKRILVELAGQVTSTGKGRAMRYALTGAAGTPAKEAPRRRGAKA